MNITGISTATGAICAFEKTVPTKNRPIVKEKVPTSPASRKIDNPSCPPTARPPAKRSVVRATEWPRLSNPRMSPAITCLRKDTGPASVAPLLMSRVRLADPRVGVDQFATRGKREMLFKESAEFTVGPGKTAQILASDGKQPAGAVDDHRGGGGTGLHHVHLADEALPDFSHATLARAHIG